MKRICLLIVLLSSFILSSRGQAFQRLTEPISMGYGSVISITQDRQGFMWLVTSNGVVRFDGYTSRSYNEKIIARTNNPYVVYYSLLSTRDNHVYLTTSCGLMCYVEEEDDFQIVNAVDYRYIFEDCTGRLWLSETNVNVAYWDVESNSVVSIYAGDNKVQGYMYTDPSCPYVYVITSEGILCMDAVSMQRKFFPYHFSNIADMQYRDSNLYILTANGQLWNYQGDKISLMLTLQSEVVSRHLLLQGTKMWIGTMRGLYCYNLRSHNLLHYVQSDDAFSLSNNSIQTLYATDTSTMWIGTYAGGVCLWNQQMQTPSHILDSKHSDIPRLPISAILEDGENIFVGTEGDGLYWCTSSGEVLYHYTTNTKPALSANNIKALVKKDDDLWIATYLGGLVRLNTRTRKIEIIRAQQRGNTILSDQVRDLCVEQDNLWIMYQSISEMITRYHIPNGSFEHFSLPVPQGEKVSPRLLQVAGGDSLIWTRTRSSVHCFSAKECRYRYSASPEKTTINFILADTANTCLWVGSQSSGLLRFDITTQTFSCVLPLSESIESLAKTNNILWMGTGSGLYGYNLDNNVLHVFNEADGVEYPIVSMTPSVQHPSHVYYGAMGTVGYVCGDKLILNTRPHHAFISDMRINNQSVYAYESPYKSYIPQLLHGKLSVRYDENNLSFDFSSTNYISNSKNTFRYRINGTEWGLVNVQQRTLSLPQLPVGKYVMELQSANNDGIWGDISTLTICVRPPFYRSVWGWIIYVLLLGLLLWYIIYTTRRHYRQRQQLFEAEVYKKYCISTATAPRVEATKKDLDKFQLLILDRISGHVDIDEVAREMGMSRRKLFDFIKKNTGHTIIEYVRHQRIAVAAKLMVEKNMTTKQVMDAVGIESQSHFVKAFTAEFGKTPSEFMTDMQEK